MSACEGESSMATVTTKIRNGVVESIEDIPTDMSIEVRNYDVLDVANGLLSKDSDGSSCQVKQWRAPE
jgi:hypothetical protein